MPLFRGCSALVIRCFKRVEHFADWITGAAGPVFVALCWTLIIGGGIIFFDVIGRGLSTFETIILSPILVLVPLNLYGQYWLVTRVPPGYPSPRAIAASPDKPMSTEREQRWIMRDQRSVWRPERWGLGRRDRAMAVESQSNAAPRRMKKCRKCDGPKPERAHHCSVCKRCVLMMDHHCPWINGCVGIYNQRHFVLFMTWISIACWCVVALGYVHFWSSLLYQSTWAAYTPRIGFTLLYVLAIAMGIAVPVLLSWHVYMISKGETSIELHDNAYLDNRASAEGLIYLNPYDLGRRQNLLIFLNITPSAYPQITLLFPFLIPPASNGWSYPRRSLPELGPGEDSEVRSPEISGRLAELGEIRGKYVMGDEGLTDDEDGGGGYVD